MPTRRKPANLRALEGNRSHEPKGRSPAPAHRADPPACPSHLRGHARREWNRLAPELHRLGLLSALDLALFESWCINVQVARMALDAWAADGFAPTVASYRGGATKHPALRALAAAETVMLAISGGRAPGR